MAKNMFLPFFALFLTIFTIFHLKFFQLCKISPSYISGTPQVMFGLVNTHTKIILGGTMVKMS